MTDVVFIIAIIGLCLLWGAWRERLNGNRRDGGLLLALGITSMLSSLGVFFSGA